MNKGIDIILPKKIAVLREESNQDIKTKLDEFSLYFKNFIYPLYPWLDIIVTCDYGKNYGNCWRLNDYPDVDSFPLTISVYDEYGEKLTEKSVTIELYDKSTEPYKVAFIGDSMTHSSYYVEHIVRKLYNIETIGTRSFNGHTFLEGRGGWSYGTYFDSCFMVDSGTGWITVPSPFMFPKNISGEEYFGDISYFKKMTEKGRSTYQFNGYKAQTIKKGQCYYSDGKLYRDGKVLDDNIEWEFNYSKYLKRNNLPIPNAVSILMGANDMQMTPYEETENGVSKYIDYTKKTIASIKAAGDIDIILNLPIAGAEQYAWGSCVGTRGSEKLYAHNMRAISRAIIEEFEGKEGIYISPMLCCMDNENAFSKASAAYNLYCDNQREYQCNWVHPAERGYNQMGDVLAGIIEKLRK